MQIAKPNNGYTYKQFFIYFILSALALYFVFSPAINIPFYHHDIYKFVTGGFHQACSHEPGFEFIMTLGRPVTAYIECLNNKVGNTLESVAYLRVLYLLLIAATISWFAVSLNKLRLSYWVALLVSSSIFFLPAMQTVMIMIASNIIITILLSFAANYFISESDADFRSHKVKAIAYLYIGLFLMLLAFFAYPSMTAFFLMPAFIGVLFKPLSEWRVTRKVVARDVFVYVVCCIMFFVLAKVLKVYVKMYYPEVIVPASYEFTLSFNLGEKFTYLYHLLPVFWNLDSGLPQAVIVYLIITTGSIVALKEFLGNKKNSTSYLLQAIFAIFVLAISGSLTYLLAPMHGWPFSRVIFIFQAMSLLVVVWSLIQISKLFSYRKDQWIIATVALLFCAGAYYANNRVAASALNDYTELNYMATSIAARIQQESTPLKRIHVIAPTVANFNGLVNHEDIFNLNSSLSAGNITYMVEAALLRFAKRHSFDVSNCIFSENNEAKHFDDEKKCIEATDARTIAVTYSRSGDAIYQTDGMMVINMNVLAPFAEINKKELNNIAGIAQNVI